MKIITTYLLSLVLFCLFSCSGSDTYRGLWKATNSNREKFDIDFAAKSFVIKDSTGKASTFDYTQNSVSIKNSIETYGIKVSDGRNYNINFPIADDESKGIITDGAGYVVYTISRTGYIQYEDISRLK